MSTRRGSATWQVVGFFIAIATLGVITSIRTGSPPQGTATELLQGRLARAYEKKFDAEFPGRQLGVNLWAAFDFAVFKEGRPGVVIGNDGWLYTSEEFQLDEHHEAIVRSNLAEIEASSRTLSEHGSHLIVVVVPSKARVYPEHLGSGRPPAARLVLHDQLIESLASMKLTVVDLLPALVTGKQAGPTFFMTDTHWTPRGAELAAGAIVDTATAKGWRAANPVAYTTRVTGVGSHTGDLLSFLPLDPWFKSLLPPPEPIDEVTSQAVPSPEAQAASGDLFGNAALPEVALVGTSYSANTAWHFSGYLEAGLGEVVANYAKEGLGPFVPMRRYLASDDFLSHAPRLVIWEITERALAIKPDSAAAGKP